MIPNIENLVNNTVASAPFYVHQLNYCLEEKGIICFKNVYQIY